MTATTLRGSIHSSFFYKEDAPSTKPLWSNWVGPYVVPSYNWSRIGDEWAHGIVQQERHFGNPQQFRVAGVYPVRAGPGSPESLDAANLVYGRWVPRGGRSNTPKAQLQNASGFSALRIGVDKAGNTVALEHGDNLYESMMEPAATDIAGQAGMRASGFHMIPSRRFVRLDAGGALVSSVEEGHEVPNVISLKVSSGTGFFPVPALVDYVSRIQELRSFGEEEDITVSRDSESDFWRFVFQFPSEQPGNLMLMQDGHLRWIWKGDDLAHVGIRFIGSGRGRYVIFKRRAGELHVSRVSGEDILEGVVQQVRSFDMTLFGDGSKQAD